MSRIAVLLVGFGAPDSLADVGQFVENVAGRALPLESVEASREKYRKIGGGSPYLAISEKQAGRLQEELRKHGIDAGVYLGMRYWRPFIADVAKRLADDQPEEVILMALTPYYSSMSVGNYIEIAKAALMQAGLDTPIRQIESWYKESALIQALAENLQKTREMSGEKTAVIFTAHSMPKSLGDGGDPYVSQVKETAELTAEAAGLGNWLFGWQSEGHGRGQWLKPTVDETVREAGARGADSVVVSPIGFISDNMETLYDLDIVLRRRAEESGLIFHRAPGLNDNGLLIEAMTSAVTKAIETKGSNK